LIIITSWLDHGAVMSECIAARAALHQQIENAEAFLPVLGLRVPQTAINDLEGARKRQAQPAHDLRQPSLHIVAVREIERRPCGKLVEDRPQLELLVQLLEFMDALLQTLGDRQVERLDDDPDVAFAVAWPRSRRS
jgi:hypothetical protein